MYINYSYECSSFRRNIFVTRCDHIETIIDESWTEFKLFEQLKTQKVENTYFIT